MLSYLRKVGRDTKDRGASAVEYGLMVAAIAAVIVGIVFGLGSLVNVSLSNSCKNINADATASSGAGTRPAPC